MEYARNSAIRNIDIEFERKRHLLKSSYPDEDDDSRITDRWDMVQPSPERLDLVQFLFVHPGVPGGPDDDGLLVEWLDNEIYRCEIGPPSVSDPA